MSLMAVEKSYDRTKTIDELLEEWNLTVRTYNVLKREGVTTLDRLTFLTEDQLWEMRNLGVKGVNEIITKLHEHGHKLAEYTPFREVIMPGLREGYQASRDGVIKSPMGHELKPMVINGRAYVSARVHGKWAKIPVALMVLSAYDPTHPQEGMHPDYHDKDPLNCRLENLFWAADGPTEKLKDFKKRGSKKRVFGESTQVTGTHTPRSDVQVYRTYVSGEVMAAISDDGSGSISVGGTTLSLTARQLRSLTLVAGRIAEVNSLMGIG
jgi:hypothetical protein